MLRGISVYTVLLGIFFLISCATANYVEYGNRATYRLEINFHEFTTLEKMQEQIKRDGYTVSDAARGFSVWSSQDIVCDVYYIKPTTVNDPKTTVLGHEVMHCIYGSYH
jgi:hypothetical protein